MIEYTTGDIFEADVEALTVPVNCKGVAGAGLALEFKQRFPDWFHHYAHVCRLGCLEPGSIHVHEWAAWHRPRIIFDFPTKRHWRDKSHIEDIDAGLRDLARRIREFEVGSVAMPAVGCGLGGLHFTDVSP